MKKVVEMITDFSAAYPWQNISLFNGLLYDPVGYDGLEKYRGFYCATHVERKELNLPRLGHKVIPGNIDVLFIPFNDDHIFYDRTAA
jgi:hypothetical protein